MIYLADAKEMKSVDSYSIQTLGIPSMVTDGAGRIRHGCAY